MKIFTLLILLSFFQCASYNKTVFISKHTNPKIPKNDRAEILHILSELNEMFRQKDLARLPAYVSEKKGLYVDLKALRTHTQLTEEIKNPDSHLNVFFLSTEKLRIKTNDSEQISVRDILLKNRKINTEFFCNDTLNECEVILHLDRTKELNFRLNNPYFIKENGKWYIYRLM